jgi:hypothetical protein
MNSDFFTQLETELGGLTRNGMHLTDPAARGRRRMLTLLRRGAAVVMLAIALAASLDSEFPATARGYAPAAVAAMAPNS